MFSIFERNPIYFKRCLETLLTLRGCGNEALKHKRPACVLVRSRRAFSALPTKFETASSLSNDPNSSERAVQIDKAMQAYLKQARDYDKFMQEKAEEFEMGKRHLCNIMGWDVENITQKDIDAGIEYLFPSGLFDLNARPVMKPPEEIYRQRKEAEFDIQGRPHHSMFYTKKPNYYKLLHDLFDQYVKLDEFEDDMIRKGVVVPSPESKANIIDSQWLSLTEIKNILLEPINDDDYNHLITALEKVANHPYSSIAKDFIVKYRKALVSASSMSNILPIMCTEDGRQYVTATGKKKHTIAEVTVWNNGTGKFTIDGQDLLYFNHFKEREQVMMPLQFTELLMKVDVEATIKQSHESLEKRTNLPSQAAAIRYALSRALTSFVNAEMVEEMRLCGLLTRDRRVRERKKVAHRGARKRFAYRKR